MNKKYRTGLAVIFHMLRIVMVVCMIISIRTLNRANFNLFSFKYMYSFVLNNRELVNVLADCFPSAYKLFFGGMLISYLFAIIVRKYYSDGVSLFDVVIDALVVFGLVSYWGICALVLRCNIALGAKKSVHFIMFLIAAVLMLVVSIILHRVDKQNFEAANKSDEEKAFKLKYEETPVIIVGIAVIFVICVLSGFKMKAVFKEYNSYKYNYGLYFKDKPVLNVELEDEMLNFINQGVVVDGVIYYIEDFNKINRVNEDGSIETIYEASLQEEERIDGSPVANKQIMFLVYHDGWLYFCSYYKYEISRVSLTGEYELLFEAPSEAASADVSFMAGKGDKLYYATMNNKKCFDIYCVNYADLKDTSKHDLYLGNIKIVGWSKSTVVAEL